MDARLLIIILCYNGVDLTLACLESLARITSPQFDVLIVDNASQDGTPERIRQAFPAVSLIETGANLGFAAGNNVGLRYALAHGYDYALLLNNDTEVAPACLERLIRVMDSDRSIGIAGPTIGYHERPAQIWSAGGWIDWQRGYSRMFTELKHSDVHDVDFVSGCALLISRAAMEWAGLLDERFFMYYEETEWCIRVQRAGFRVVHVPDAFLTHKIPLNARADKVYVAYYMTRNRLLFLQATQARFRAWVDTLVLQDLRTCLSLSLRPKWAARRLHRDAMLRAWWDFLHGRFGAAELS